MIHFYFDFTKTKNLVKQTNKIIFTKPKLKIILETRRRRENL